MIFVWFASILLVAGSLLVVIGGVGLLRFPDFFTRLHAVGVTDTLGAWLILIGLMLFSGWGFITVKLVLIMLFLILPSPTSSHALAKAALHGKILPMTESASECNS
mgnify:CR=1 FL=1